MTASGARMTIGATAAGVFGDGRAVDHGPAVAVWAATLPGARSGLPAGRAAGSGDTDARLPALDGDERAAVLLVDPHTFPLAGFLPHTGALPVVGGLASARGGPGRTGCSSTGRCTPTARSGCSSAETCASRW